MSENRSHDLLTAPMPDSSRSRSDSLDESSASHQDRKRPRLSSGSADHLPSEEALIDTGCPDSVDTPSLIPPSSSASSRLAPLQPSSPDKMTPSSPSGRASKVTINTRTYQGRSSSQDTASLPPKSANPVESLPPSMSPNGSHEVTSAHDSSFEPPLANSTASSASRSPEIQAAELEDIDQSPTETRWTPVFSTNTTAPVVLSRRYVQQTFPYAQDQCSPGNVHLLFRDMGKIFLHGKELFVLHPNYAEQLV